jgi:uncharacterized protein (DUF488 family)
MQTVTRLYHTAKTVKGLTVRTPMAIGQVWIHGGSRHVVDRVYRKQVRFLIAKGKVLMTCDQARFVKHSRLKTD